MPKVDLFNMNGDVVGEIQLADEIFGSENINETVIHQVVKQQLANKRQGTQSAKTRSEVSRRRKETLQTKGHRQSKTGLYPRSSVSAWRRCVCAKAEGLQL